MLGVLIWGAIVVVMGALTVSVVRAASYNARHEGGKGNRGPE